MNKPFGLPATLRTKLAALGRRIRLLRALRGASLLLLTLVVLLGGIFLADLLLDLPSEVLRGAAVAVGVAALLVVIVGLVVPLCRRFDTEGLAALIEERYPELGERLTTTVELAGKGDSWHGSHALIELLIDETERRAHPLDFTRAFPARATGWLTLAALLAVLGAGLPALVWGDRYAEFGQRLLSAWSPAEPEPAARYALQVNPGNTHAARGRPLSLLVLAHAEGVRMKPAASATLVYTDAEARPVRVRMPADPAALPALAAGTVAFAAAPGALPLSAPAPLLAGVGPRSRVFAYHFDKLTGDLPFHVEVGDARSDSYRVTAVDPVELAPDSPTATVAAPAYANPTVHPEQKVAALSELFAHEYGRVTFDFRFTRPAVVARLEVARKGETGRAAQAWALPLPLEGDRQQALFQVPSLRQGNYDLRLILEAEHGIRTAYDLRPLTVRADEAPAFTRKPEVPGFQPTEARPDWNVAADPTGGRFNPVRGGVGGSNAREVAPGDTVKLKVTAEDDLGMDKVELEYRVNGGPSRFETIADGAGQLKAEPPQGEYGFRLAGKVKEGDVVLYRVKAADNRRVAKASFRDADGRAAPGGKLEPHVIYFPERLNGKDRWFALRVNSKAEPLAKQEIEAERDRVRQKLDAIQKKLGAERGQLTKVRNETRNRPQLSPEQKSGVQALRRDNRAVRTDLRQLADETAQSPALQQITDVAQQVADQEMTRSDEALNQAQNKKTDAPRREQQFQKADEELARAQKQLDLLKQQNEKLARDRLDQLKLEQLAQRQQELGKRAADVAAKNPMQDPEAKKDLDALRAEQTQVAEELKRLTEQSDLFKTALDAAAAEQAKQLADQAKELAEAQRDLNEAAKDGLQKELQGKFAELARKQQELAQKATELARETAQPAKAANKQPLRPDAAQKAADALKQGDPTEAVQKQDQSAKELDRLALDLDKAMDLARDPREAARQLANLQEALKKRVQEEMNRKGEKTPVGERVKKFRPEQEALLRAVKALEVHEAQKPAKDAQKQATERMANATKALEQQNPHWAKDQMEQARQALLRLAQTLPSEEQRRQQALNQVADLRRHQEDLARQAEQTLKNAEQQKPAAPKAQVGKMLAAAAQRQAQLAERLGKLDIPGQKPRQDRTEKALNKALNDLLEPQVQDVPASQQEAKRELERLEQALRGQQPADEKARELARKQKELNQEAAKLAAAPEKATPAEMKALQEKQQQIAKETQALPAQDAPLQAAEAAKATKQAAEAAKAQPAAPAAQQKMADAAKALDKLADQLAGKENNAARAERLAEAQAKLAADAEKQPAKANAAEAQQQQKQIADEAKQVRGDQEAAAEKKQAAEALAKAQQPGQAPAQQAKAQHAAADALRDLADKLAGRNDAAAKAAELARQQRDLAKEVAGEKKDPTVRRPEQNKDDLAELARKAAQKQADLARQTERLNAKGAEQAQKQAAEQMAAAQKALDQAKDPAQAKEALTRAAQAADDLAKELARQQAAKPAPPKAGEHTAAKPGQQAPKQTAQQLAQQQKQLAQATQRAQQQAQGKPAPQQQDALKQALENVAKQQAQLNQQAAQLEANKAQTGLEKARQAMNQAQEALQKNDAPTARRKQQEAADALAKLARQLPDKAPAQAAPKEPGAPPQGLPTKQQAEQARQLAKEQKDLRDAVQKMAAEAAALRKTQPEEQNPLGELARKQKDIAQETAKLAKDVAKEQGQQAPVAKQAQDAAQQAQKAAQQAQVGAAPQAQKTGEQLAQNLRKLAQDLNNTPRGDADPKAPEPAQRAAQLAQKQEELNRQMKPQAADLAAQKAQQDARQGELAKQTGELAKELGKLGQEAGTPQAKVAANQATNAAKQAQQAMQQAQAQAKQGNEGKAGQEGQKAAQLLAQAAQQAAQAAQQMAKAPGQPGQKPGQQADNQAGKETGQALQQGKEQIGQAQAKLGQGQPKDAQGAMAKAADALQQAAAKAGQQLTKPQQSGQPTPFAKEPGPKGAAPVGAIDLGKFGKEMKKYAGRSWGELPGELRTRILQDMRARYGEDYAGIIQRYFEQIADTNRSRRK